MTVAKDLVNTAMSMLGKAVEDKVSGFKGMAAGVNFDAYGCVQVCVTPKVDKDGKRVDSEWFDVKRLKVGDEQVMPVPSFTQTKFGEENGGNDLPRLNI